jgi:hypothetical protein
MKGDWLFGAKGVSVIKLPQKQVGKKRTSLVPGGTFNMRFPAGKKSAP